MPENKLPRKYVLLIIIAIFALLNLYFLQSIHVSESEDVKTKTKTTFVKGEEQFEDTNEEERASRRTGEKGTNSVNDSESTSSNFERNVYTQELERVGLFGGAEGGYELKYYNSDPYEMRMEADEAPLVVTPHRCWLKVSSLPVRNLPGSLVSSRPLVVNKKDLETPQVTIFSLPKPFSSSVGRKQRNAILSWKQMKPTPEIILFGNDEGVKEFAEEHGLKHMPYIERHEKYGGIMLDRIFSDAESIAQNGTWMMYINADIILLPNSFQAAFDASRRNFDKFLMIGSRSNIDLEEEIVFDEEGNWEFEIANRVLGDGENRILLDDARAMDYFLYQKPMWANIPRFMIGRTLFDSWLVWDLLKRKMPVVDASYVNLALHQKHTYEHMEGGANTATGSGTPYIKMEEMMYNWEQAGDYMSVYGGAQHTQWMLRVHGRELSVERRWLPCTVDNYSGACDPKDENCPYYLRLEFTT